MTQETQPASPASTAIPAEEPAPAGGAPEGKQISRAQRNDRILEVISTILLGVVAVLTAWSGYQATRWSGVQAASYAQASARRVDATRASTLGGQLAQIDVTLFSNWVNAYATGNQQLADFYRRRFRSEFLPAFEAWVATDPKNNPNAPATPFQMSEYKVARFDEGARLEAEAAQRFDEGQAANDISDQYILTGVVFATVLFFVAIAERFDWQAVQVAVLVVAGALLAFGIFRLVTYPIQ